MENVGKIILGGFVGTLAMTLILYFVPPLFGHPAQDIAGEMGGLILKIEPPDTTAMVVGMLIHFAMGTLVLALIYGYVLYGVLPGPALIKGLFWGLILYLLAQLVLYPVIPMIGGLGGYDLSLMFKGEGMLGPPSIWSFATHMVYGFFLGLIGRKTKGYS